MDAFTRLKRIDQTSGADETGEGPAVATYEGPYIGYDIPLTHQLGEEFQLQPSPLAISPQGV